MAANRQKLIHLHSGSKDATKDLLDKSGFVDGEIAVRNGDQETSALFVKAGTGEPAKFITETAVNAKVETASTAASTAQTGVNELKGWKKNTVDPFIEDVNAGKKVVNTFGTKKGDITLDTPVQTKGDGKVSFSMNGNKLTGTVLLGTAAAQDDDYYAKQDEFTTVKTNLGGTSDKTGTTAFARIYKAETAISNITGGTSAVTSLGGETGAITLDTDATNYKKVKLTIESGKELQGTLNVGSAASHDDNYFATAVGLTNVSGALGTKGTASDDTAFGLIKKNQDAIDSLTSGKGNVTNISVGTSNFAGDVPFISDPDGLANGDVYFEAKNSSIVGKVHGLGSNAYNSNAYVFQTTYDTYKQNNDTAVKGLRTDLGNTSDASTGTTKGTAFGRIKGLEEKVASLSSATHFIGKFDALPDGAGVSGTPTQGYKGDVVIVGNKEFIYNAGSDAQKATYVKDNWVELGDTSIVAGELTTLKNTVEANDEKVGSLTNASGVAGNDVTTKIGNLGTDLGNATTKLDNIYKAGMTQVTGSNNIKVTQKVTGNTENGIAANWLIEAQNLVTTDAFGKTETEASTAVQSGKVVERPSGLTAHGITVKNVNTELQININDMVIDCGTYE